MSSIYRLGITTVLLGCLFAGGCGGEQKQDSDAGGEHGHADTGEVAEIPNTYSAAVARCEAHTRRIAELIESGELHDVHAEAAYIRDIARKLPELAKVSMPPEMLKEINLESKELAGLFVAIDKAADSGDKEGTIRVHEQMMELVAILKSHTGHESDHEGHEHEK